MAPTPRPRGRPDRLVRACRAAAAVAGRRVSPWAVLVSEFMLQQTQVARVVPGGRRGSGAGRRRPRSPPSRRRGGARLGPAGLPAPGAVAAPGRRRDRRAPRRRGPRRPRRPPRAAGRRPVHGTGDRGVRVRPAASGGRHQHPPRDRARRPRPGPSRSPVDGPRPRRDGGAASRGGCRGASFNAAAMELGATVCTARSPALRRLPDRRRRANGALAGYPPYEGPRKAVQATIRGIRSPGARARDARAARGASPGRTRASSRRCGRMPRSSSAPSADSSPTGSPSPTPTGGLRLPTRERPRPRTAGDAGCASMQGCP